MYHSLFLTISSYIPCLSRHNVNKYMSVYTCSGCKRSNINETINILINVFNSVLGNKYMCKSKDYFNKWALVLLKIEKESSVSKNHRHIYVYIYFDLIIDKVYVFWPLPIIVYNYVINTYYI